MRSDEESTDRLSRRWFLRGALLASAGTGVGLAAAPAYATTDWSSYSDEVSGASISYPSDWSISTKLCTALMYPHEAFGVLSGPQPTSSDQQFPILDTYPNDGALLWVIYYDDIVDGEPFTAGLRISDLYQSSSEFTGFYRYGGIFAGSQRTFLLRLWVGTQASSDTTGSVDQSLSSLSVP